MPSTISTSPNCECTPCSFARQDLCSGYICASCIGFEMSKHRDYVALGVAVYFLVNVHAYSFTFLLTLGIYHLLFVPRNQKWKTVIRSVVFGAASVCTLRVIVLITRGIERASPVLDDVKAGSWEALATWLSLGTNGQPLLPLISLVGLALWREGVTCTSDARILEARAYLCGFLDAANRCNAIRHFAYDAISTARLAIHATGYDGWTLCTLYVYHKWLGALVFLWVIAGLVFQSNIEWRPYIGGRSYSFEYPPWQVIAPMAESNPNRSPDHCRISCAAQFTFEWPSMMNYSQREHYFDRAGVVIEAVYDPHEYQIHIIHRAIVSPRVWVLFRKAIASEAQVMEIKQVMS